MNPILLTLQEKVYSPSLLLMSKLVIETEGKDYHACKFQLNDLKIICRNAKVTPKKAGQFVTFWKRDSNGITTPFDENDDFDFYVINVSDLDKIGQFVFPKSVLIEKGITTTSKKDGKRGFRVYPSWDNVISNQAIKTQQWQLRYFIKIGDKNTQDQATEIYRSHYNQII